MPKKFFFMPYLGFVIKLYTILKFYFKLYLRTFMCLTASSGLGTCQVSCELLHRLYYCIIFLWYNIISIIIPCKWCYIFTVKYCILVNHQIKNFAQIILNAVILNDYKRKISHHFTSKKAVSNRLMYFIFTIINIFKEKPSNFQKCIHLQNCIITISKTEREHDPNATNCTVPTIYGATSGH